MTKFQLPLFVSPLGKDAWTGRYADPLPDGADGPLATLAMARNRLRRIQTADEKRVWVRGGVYYLGETLRFGPADGGAVDAPVVYAAWPGESVTLSGGVVLDGWTPGEVNGHACWMLDLPAGLREFTQLFVNGERRPWSRLPKTGCYTWRDTPAIRPVPDQQFYDGPDRAIFAKGTFGHWKNMDDIRITTLNIWLDNHHRIRRIDARRNTVYFRSKSITHLTDPGKQPGRFFIENVFEALTDPGQWYLDRPTGRLYYLPMEGERLFNTQMIAPRLETLVHVCGNSRRPVAHLRFENLAFRHAEWDYAPDDPGSVQAACKVPGAVIFEQAEDCVVSGCDVSQVAQAAIEVATGCHNIRIECCALHDLGGGGVRIGTNRVGSGARRPAKTLRRRSANRPMAATVTDCRIYDASLKFPSAVGIWIGNVGYNRIAHNEIFNVGYTGISCGWTWSYEPTPAMANRIEYNHIHHVNRERNLADNGGIYMLGSQPGTVLRGNHIHDIGCHEFGGFGIYLDEGSSDMLVERNLVHHTEGAGFYMTYGRDNIVRNNIFALPAKTILGFAGPDQFRRVIFECNIVFWRRSRFQLWGEWPAGTFQLRNNLFWQGRDQPLVLGSVLWKDSGKARCAPISGTLEDWQRQGQHLGSIHADPLFVDPDGGDFTLRPGSPALRVGFKPFNVSVAGPRGADTSGHRAAAAIAPDLMAHAVVRCSIERRARGRATLTVENVGPQAVSGGLGLRVWPRGAAVVSPRTGLSVHELPPGRRRRMAIRLAVAPRTSLWMLEAVPRHGEWTCPVACLLLDRPHWNIPLLADAPDDDRLSAVLGALVPVAVHSGAETVAVLRMARTSDALALLADVRDSGAPRGTRDDAGSGLELFGAPCRDDAEFRQVDRGVFDGEPRGPVAHVAWIPIPNGEPCRSVPADGNRTKRIETHAQWWDGGYRMAVRVPVAWLNIPSGGLEPFLIEVVVNTHAAAGQPIRAALFGSANPALDSIRFGRGITPVPGVSDRRRGK